MPDTDVILTTIRPRRSEPDQPSRLAPPAVTDDLEATAPLDLGVPSIIRLVPDRPAILELPSHRAQPSTEGDPGPDAA